MKIKPLTLSILTVSAVIATAQASFADTSAAGDPRYIFDGQTYGEHKHHHSYFDQAPQAVPQAVVRSGSMPANILGLNPSWFSKPPAPSIQTPAVIQTMTATMAARPIVKPPAVAESFKPAFGKPTTAAPVVVAGLPQTPQQEAARPSAPAKPISSTSTKIGWSPKRPATAHTANTGHTAGPAKAISMPIAKGYGEGVGYAPTTFTVAGAGNSTSTVSGVIVRKH